MALFCKAIGNICHFKSWEVRDTFFRIARPIAGSEVDKESTKRVQSRLRHDGLQHVGDSGRCPPHRKSGICLEFGTSAYEAVLRRVLPPWHPWCNRRCLQLLSHQDIHCSVIHQLHQMQINDNGIAYLRQLTHKAGVSAVQILHYACIFLRQHAGDPLHALGEDAAQVRELCQCIARAVALPISKQAVHALHGLQKMEEAFPIRWVIRSLDSSTPNASECMSSSQPMLAVSTRSKLARRLGIFGQWGAELGSVCHIFCRSLDVNNVSLHPSCKGMICSHGC
mmetsp:Transcript_157945/g.291158  ORF Transcript_157945/g.291158 Transcript_157945/m.291158 type:complete len:281 (+) Transcript_157945:765-1607(+)